MKTYREQEINAHLSSLRPERRPETSYRTRIQSVAYLIHGAYEATDANGSTEIVTAEKAENWLR